MKKALPILLATSMGAGNAQTIDGWFEVSGGTPTGNLRLYPGLQINDNLILQSLMDFNDYFPFSKTDLKAKGKGIGSFELSPVLTGFTDAYSRKIMGGPNLSYERENLFGNKNMNIFGFEELSLDPSNLKESSFYSYNSLVGKRGRVGIFTWTPINDPKSTYAEIEATGNDFGNAGISPYARVNFWNGKYYGSQAGISVNPRQTAKWLRGRGHRGHRGKK